MSALSKVIHEVNWISIFTNQRKIDGRSLTVGDAIRIFKFIDSEMSPENLACDGERPARSVTARAKMLKAADAALTKKGFRSPKFSWRV